MRHCRIIYFTLGIAALAATPGKANVRGELSEGYIAAVDSADRYIAHERWADAERMTLKALQTEPANKSNWLLWSNLGDIRMRMLRPEDAVEAYDIGLSRMPQSKRMLNSRAAAFIEMDMKDRAMDDLDKSLQLDSLQSWALNIRGNLNMAKGDIINARRDFDALYRNFPRMAQGAAGLARIQALDGDTDRAVSLFDEALNIEPDVNLYIYKISTLIEADRLPQAADAVREAMKRFPRTGNLFLMRAWIHKLQFQNEQSDIDRKLAAEYGADSSLMESIFGIDRK